MLRLVFTKHVRWKNTLNRGREEIIRPFAGRRMKNNKDDEKSKENSIGVYSVANIVFTIPILSTIKKCSYWKRTVKLCVGYS